MKKPFFKTVVAILAIIVICSCSETKKTNRELYEVPFQETLEVGLKILIDKGADSIAARNYMTCMLETMYQLDSTYFLKDRDYADKLFTKNEDKFQKCKKYLPSKDSLRYVNGS